MYMKTTHISDKEEESSYDSYIDPRELMCTWTWLHLHTVHRYCYVDILGRQVAFTHL